MSRPQEPLYLPSNSELHVSVWRLTGRRRVWYEWYAESFLWLPNPVAGDKVHSTPLSPVSMFLGSPQHAMASSPLVDAVETFSFPDKREPTRPIDDALTESHQVVKIGQTSIHNPSGRSSWIGL
jgi:protein arginine N-methyltransferase 5